MFNGSRRSSECSLDQANKNATFSNAIQDDELLYEPEGSFSLPHQLLGSAYDEPVFIVLQIKNYRLLDKQGNIGYESLYDTGNHSDAQHL